MLTTPYKVLIACSSLLLLAAVGHRLVSAVGGGGAPLAATEPAGGGDPASGGNAEGFQGAPMPPLEVPPPRVDPPVADATGAAGRAGDRGGDMVPLGFDPAPTGPVTPTPPPDAAPPAAVEDDPGVPTLVIGRQPGEQRQPPVSRPSTPADDADADADPEAPAEERVYVVRPGDSLQAIASRTLGDANRWGRIAELNPGVDPLRLQVGDRLRLPTEAAAPPAGVQPARTGPAAAAVHTVKAGDSLSVIALRYYGDSTRWRAIFEANRSVMETPDDLGIGVQLRIPPAAASDR